jgi:tetratricopeptide (TPR) repeat protein
MSEARAVTAANRTKAKRWNEEGLKQYERWECESAIKSFERASQFEPDNPDFYLNIARVLARSGNYEYALRALGEFIRYEQEDTALVQRFEALFSNTLDSVERLITSKMPRAGLSLEEVGAAIQMWLEFRIAWGRRALEIRKPGVWAAVLDYAVRKVNFRELTQKQIATMYGISEKSLRARFNDLMETLDLMPCDYRYFRGKENPLDKLVEAAVLLEKLEERFQKV